MNGRAEVPLETDKKSAFGVGQVLGACAAVVVLLAAVAPAAEATPPGANGKLVYNSVNPTTFVEGIFLTNPDGSASEQITQGRDFFPVWSPDGNRVAFLRWSGSGSDIWVVNADGTGLTQITTAASRPSQRELAWSPDGRRIAFSKRGDIYAINVDGTVLTNLTNTRGIVEVQPAWSPSGTALAFAEDSSPSLAHAMIAIRNLITGAVRPVTQSATPSSFDFFPSWSPTGTRIAFTRCDYPFCDIWILNRRRRRGAKTNLTRLTPADLLSDLHPVWSPDGTKIAFAENSGWPGVFPYSFGLVNVNGTGKTAVPGASGGEYGFDWQPRPVADLSLTMSDSPDPATVGGTLTYTTTIQNQGPNRAFGIALREILPQGVSAYLAPEASQPGCYVDSHLGTTIVYCSFDTLASGATATVSISVTPNFADVIEAGASVASTSNDPQAGNNSATATTTVAP